MLLGLLLAPVPAAGQVWVVQATTGWLNFGPLVRETAAHVRLGNMGSDIYFGLSVERSLSRGAALYASVVTAPTSIMVWPRRSGEPTLNRFSFRPFPGAADLTTERDLENAVRLRTGAVSWTCGSAGVARRFGVVRGAGGLVLCGLTGLNQELWGSAGIRIAPGLEADLGVRVPITPSLELGGSCNATALVNHRGFVRMREGSAAASGGSPAAIGPAAAVVEAELPRLEPQRIGLPLRCGLVAGVSL